MTCPTCPPDGQCSACLAEGMAKRPGRPKKADKRTNLTLHVHPDFKAHLEALAKREGLSLGRCVEKKCGFKP